MAQSSPGYAKSQRRSSRISVHKRVEADTPSHPLIYTDHVSFIIVMLPRTESRYPWRHTHSCTTKFILQSRPVVMWQPERMQDASAPPWSQMLFGPEVKQIPESLWLLDEGCPLKATVVHRQYYSWL